MGRMNIFLFDIDGTLIASGGAGKAAMEAALTTVCGVTEVAGRVEYSGRTDRAIVGDLLRMHGAEDTADNARRFFAAYLDHLPGSLAACTGKVLPGIAALLERLGNDRTALVGLLTGNIRAGARAKLGHFGLHHHFLLGGYGDNHLCRNDVAREAIAEVHRHLNGRFRLEKVWVIGDTPLDIRCARSVGAKVAAVATGWHSREELAAAKPDLLLDDFSDPDPLLACCG
jgi:phosphoglycolate phosphatase-like HAD superfamily hydrolase